MFDGNAVTDFSMESPRDFASYSTIEYTHAAGPRRDTTFSTLMEPEWLRAVIEEVANLEQLQENWNTYGASRISPSAIEAAIFLLRGLARPMTPRPSIVPTSMGAVQIEWHTGGLDLELEVESRTKIRFYYENERSGEEVEEEVNYDLARLSHLVATLESVHNSK